MALFNIDFEYLSLIKLIKRSKLDKDSINYLVNYVNEVKDGKRINDFIDFDMLAFVIMKIVDSKIYNKEQFSEIFAKNIGFIKSMFPQGNDTKNYEQMKKEFFVNYDNYINENMFDKKFMCLFDNRDDYLQIMNIIFDDDFLKDNYSSIVSAAIELGKEIDDSDLLKREIIAFLHTLANNLTDDQAYISERIDEARKRYGVYPGINEKTIATISREVDKARSLVKKLEAMDSKVNLYYSSVDAKTKDGIKSIDDAVNSGVSVIENTSSKAVLKMQNDINEAKKVLLVELNKYLEGLQESLKTSSDKVFNQMLIDSREKLDQIRAIANGLTSTTSSELLRIQKKTEESMDALKNYVETNPALKSSLDAVSRNDEVMKALLEFTSKNKQLVEKEKVVVPSKEIVVPVQEESPNNVFVPKFKMTRGILHAFDRSKAFKERMKKIEDTIAKLESEGYIIPSSLREALPWYMMGKKIVYFYGPTQSGKTTVAELLAKVVQTKIIDGGKITEDHSITSYNDVRGVFDENALFYALYYGMTVLYDEYDNGNPDNLVVLGTFSSKLVNKIDHPDREVFAQFAKRRFVPINANARIITAGNTTGKGRNREYTARNRMDESSQERLVPIYVGYNDEVEQKIFGKYDEWYEFFKTFREQCNNYAKQSSFDSAEGNVTTGDASTIVECINENAIDAFSLIDGIFVQTKEDDYLAYLVKNIKAKFDISYIDEEKVLNLNESGSLSDLSANDIAKAFVYVANAKMTKGKSLSKKR